MSLACKVSISSTCLRYLHACKEKSFFFYCIVLYVYWYPCYTWLLYISQLSGYFWLVCHLSGIINHFYFYFIYAIFHLDAIYVKRIRGCVVIFFLLSVCDFLKMFTHPRDHQVIKGIHFLNDMTPSTYLRWRSETTLTKDSYWHLLPH